MALAVLVIGASEAQIQPFRGGIWFVAALYLWMVVSCARTTTESVPLVGATSALWMALVLQFGHATSFGEHDTLILFVLFVGNLTAFGASRAARIASGR